jgi:TonB family protein
MPKLISSVDPDFSGSARKRKINCTVAVMITVQADASIANANTIQSCAERYTNKKDHAAALTLDQQALKAINQYKFEPGLFDGKSVPIELKVEVNFQIF